MRQLAVQRTGISLVKWWRPQIRLLVQTLEARRPWPIRSTLVESSRTRKLIDVLESAVMVGLLYDTTAPYIANIDILPRR